MNDTTQSHNHILSKTILNNYSIQICSIFFGMLQCFCRQAVASLSSEHLIWLISILLNIFGWLVSFEMWWKIWTFSPEKGHMDIELYSIPFIIPFNYSFLLTSLFYLQSLTCTLKKSSWSQPPQFLIFLHPSPPLYQKVQTFSSLIFILFSMWPFP